jgi:putative transposase
MARPLRMDVEGGWYHVTSRGIERRTIFRNDRDREHFLERLEAMVGRFGIVLHAYVMMDNHYHVIVECPEANLSRSIQWLNVSYVAWFNRRHDRVGPSRDLALWGATSVAWTRRVWREPFRHGKTVES